MKVDKISVIGGDSRIIKLVEMLADDDIKIKLYGLEKAEKLKNIKNVSFCNSIDETINDTNIIIGPIPFSKDNIKINTINNVFTEVYDIICHMDEKLKSKIPKRFIKIIKENRNLNYSVNIDYNQNISNWNIIYDTKVMLSVIYRDFLVDDKKRCELKKNDRLLIE